MTLKKIQFSNVRNLQSVKMDGLEKANVFYGQNGSGKTSILEAIHILGMSRSFRGSSIKSLISHQVDSCTVHGLAASSTNDSAPIALGVYRDRSGASKIKVAGKLAHSVAELLEHLPLQLINTDSFDLLTGTPSARRNFLNWGVFHVEHRFYPEWQRFQRGIKQRNKLLRRGNISVDEISAWTRDLAASGTVIHSFRSAYLERLAPGFQFIMSRLMPELAEGLEVRYRRGWDRSMSYQEALAASSTVDLDQGYTHVGPQRADLKLFSDGHSAAETLSRGQQKLLVCGLKLAQGMLLADSGGKRCTFLVDDLPSELDEVHSRRVCELLASMDAQVFITTVEKKDISRVWPCGESIKMFHVEHGSVNPDTPVSANG
ncbi:MAG: DNA replication/repair protein RecF [Halioglobus sp.]